VYIYSIILIVASNIVYNICQKSTPQRANPFLTLTVTYLTAALFTIVVYLFNKPDKGFIKSIAELNWTSIALGISIVGLEFGYLMAYRANWNISIATLVANIFLAIALIPVGILIYKEGFEFTKIFGVALCIIGLVLINKK